MVTEKDVYIAYRRAKSLQSDKGFRLPKDWDHYFNNKLSPKNREYLEKLTGYFNTTFSNIDIDRYMECGFALYKTFSYHMFLRPNILDLYKEKDKQRKRKTRILKETIDESLNYIERYMENKELLNGYNMLQSYCKLREGDKKVIVSDYLKGHVDQIIFAYCIYYKYIKLSDIEREYCYNVVNRYRDILEQMFEVEHIIKEREK